MLKRSVAATIGVTSAAIGVAVGHALAAVINPASSPVVAVAGVVIDASPMPVKEWAIQTFGVADKAVLLVGTLLLLGLIAAGAGILAQRSRARGVAVVVAIGLLGILAAIAKTSSAAGDLPIVLFWLVSGLPGIVATAASTVALVWQFSRYEPAEGHEEDFDRRRFLIGSGGMALGAGVLAVLGIPRTAPTAETVSLPKPAKPASPLPGGLEAQVKGVTPLATPIEKFYRIDTAVGTPYVDAATWRLSIEGRVAKPYSLSFEELLALPLVERHITLTCVSNPIGGPLCGSTKWTGVLVADLLRRAEPEAGTDMVLSQSYDGYTASTPLEALLDGRDAMIAVAMDGQPLTATHGAPARLLTPGLYGYVGATKWLTKLKVTTFAADQAYWTRLGWADRAPVKTATRIDTPSKTIKAGQVPIAGVSWATHRGISKVEVRIDGGPWQQATLGPDVGLDYWRQWYLPWDATPGTHRLTARSYDSSGVVETEQEQDVLPDGATGYPVVTVTVI